MKILDKISEMLQKGKAREVQELIEAAIKEGISPKEILEDGLLKGMEIIGGKFKNNEVFVPEVLIAARAMNIGTGILKEYLKEGNIEKKGIVVLGAVKGDLHDIGKNLVKMMMEGKGLYVIDLGVDVSCEKFIEEARKNKADIIACAALLTTTMEEMKNIVNKVRTSDIRNINIMVGGAPVTQEFADIIGANAYGKDAASAADKAIELCKKR